jgi:putative ABC transport system permease protein
MIPTYLKIAFRNFVKDKFYAGINVFGLAVGIAVALLIALYCYHELSYDRFHANANRLYRVAMHLEVGGNIADMNSTFPPMAEAMEAEIPEVEKAVRLYIQNGRIFKQGEKIFTEDKILFADSAFFSVFDFKVLAGNSVISLANRNQILLTPALARKYFDTEDWSAVVGRSISINQDEFQVTGVVEAPPANSHFIFSAIASIESIAAGRDKTWNNLNLSTYFLLKDGASIETVAAKIDGLFKKHLENYEKHASEGLIMRPFFQPMLDIHLKSNIQGEFEPNGSMLNLYVFFSVAIVVLLLACVNFINLITARSSNRAREVGIRKVLGSASQKLMVQFIVECIILVAVATLLSLGAVELMRAPFNFIAGKDLPFDILLSPRAVALIAIFVLFLGFVAGAYPAFYLSSFHPAEVLKGKSRGVKGSRLRNFLVVLQFFISITLITCTLVVQKQLSFMRSKKLGFDKENILVIENANRLQSQATFVNTIKSIPGVESAGAATSKPVDDYDGMLIETEKDKDNRKLVNFAYVDHDYLSVMRYEFVEGRNFSRDFPSDSSAVVINERAAEFLFGETAIGEKLINNNPYSVIGIVKNFNFESLRNEVRPLVFYLHSNQRFLHVRLSPGDYVATVAALENEWKKQTSEIPFSYIFLDETYNNLFKEEVKLGMLFSFFTGLALFIACLGLLGLVAYMAEQRKKEISVRKVLGATVSQMVLLLSGNFGKLIVIGFAMSVPVAYYMMTKWLEGFVYKIEIPIYLLVGSGFIVVAIAFAAVSYQAIKAALLNPVDALKEE